MCRHVCSRLLLGVLLHEGFLHGLKEGKRDPAHQRTLRHANEPQIRRLVQDVVEGVVTIDVTLPFN